MFKLMKGSKTCKRVCQYQLVIFVQTFSSWQSLQCRSKFIS